jgi:hypothetical protein
MQNVKFKMQNESRGLSIVARPLAHFPGARRLRRFKPRSSGVRQTNFRDSLHITLKRAKARAPVPMDAPGARHKAALSGAGSPFCIFNFKFLIL